MTGDEGDLLEASAPPFSRLLGGGRQRELGVSEALQPDADMAREALASRLVGLAPPGVDRARLTRDRGAAVNAAWALAREHHAANGQPTRTIAIARAGADHGTDAVPFQRISNTKVHRSGLSEWRLGQSRLAELENTMQAAGAANIALLMLEPIQHAGGCIYAPQDYWAGVREMCDRFGILLVVDEAVTGLGRLGAWYATDELVVRPDLIVLGESLTSAYAPLGAVLLHANVRAPVGAHEDVPPAAAIALRNLDALERNDVLGDVRRLTAYLAARLGDSIVPLANVGDVRGAGFLWAVELAPRAATADALRTALRAAGLRAHVEAVEDHLLVQLAPPLVSGPAEIDALVERLERALGSLID